MVAVMKRLTLLMFAITICFGCAQSAQTIKPDPSRVQHVDGFVQSLSGNEVIVVLNLPEFKKTADTPAAEISQQIVQKGLFIEGLDIAIENHLGEITKVTGNVVTILHRKPVAYAIGQIVKLEIPKKRIAIVDFTVIRGGLKEAGTILMEQLSSLLIESRHYTVVERSKLNTIMEELKLVQSGLTEAIPEQMRPKLLFADLILTGTLAEIGDKYDINLRLLNVKTGQAVAAIQMSAPLFKPVEMRDSNEWNEDFETDPIDRSWAVGSRGWGTREGFVNVDEETGAENSKRSLKMDFSFDLNKKQRSCLGIRNEKKRDLSLFKGIEFYIRGTHRITSNMVMDISDRDDHVVRNRWRVRLTVTDQWQRIRVPFNELAYIRDPFLMKEGFKPGKQILDLSHVESVLFVVCSDFVNEASKTGTLWVDKIRFYKQ